MRGQSISNHTDDHAGTEEAEPKDAPSRIRIPDLSHDPGTIVSGSGFFGIKSLGKRTTRKVGKRQSRNSRKIAAKGRRIYRRKIQPKMRLEDKGKLVVIDV